ncbi:MAG: hypothetical protein ACREEB_07010 [Caulobacteraceae bacterium]
MAVARQSQPKWVDPDSMWEDDDNPTVVEMIRPEMNIDRFHNHEDMSPEAMAKVITELQATVEALDTRLAAAEEGASGATHAAKDLGVSMFKMGDALTKRMKHLEDSVAEAAMPAPAPVPEPAPEEAPMFAPIAKPAVKERRVLLTVGLAVLLAAAVGAVVLLHPMPLATRASPPPAQVLYAPSTPATN